jgi:hypothetical protein
MEWTNNKNKINADENTKPKPTVTKEEEIF